MSSVVISGDTSGTVTLAAPANAGTTTLTLPTTSGTVATISNGTWTPVLAQSGLTITQTENAGNYTKVGRIVTCSMYIQTTTITGTGSSTITVSGLPFPNVGGIGFSCRENVIGGFTWDFFASGGASQLTVFRYDNTTLLSSNISWIASFSYLTNS